MSLRRLVALAGVLLAALVAAPTARASSTCDDYSTQAAAQRAGDTRDGDGDGLLCEDLPCPCGGPGSGASTGAPAPGRRPAGCTRPRRVVAVVFSASRYPSIRRHFRSALRQGWPRILVVNRPGSDERRDRLLQGIPTRTGYDRDEYPPAVGRGRGAGLVRGGSPRGWMGDVRYVDPSENRSQGASLGGQLRPYCNGTKFKYVFD